jgi:hypothetical protein
VHYHLVRPPFGGLSLVNLPVQGLEQSLLREEEYSTVVRIPASKIEEVGIEEFVRALPRMATEGLERSLCDQLSSLRSQVAWSHFLFSVRQPIRAWGTVERVDPAELGDAVSLTEAAEATLTGERILCAGFVFTMVLGVAVAPCAPVDAAESFYMSFPFFTRPLPENIGDVEEDFLTPEGQRRLSDLLSGCFCIGRPSEA